MSEKNLQHVVSSYSDNDTSGIHDIQRDNNIDIAVLNNVQYLSKHIDEIIELNAIELPHDSLKKLLFSNAGFFYISKANANNKTLLLNLQTYSKIHFNKVKFNLNEQLLAAYSNKNSQSVSQITSISKILLFKEIKNLVSLVNFIGTQTTLSYDEAIRNLIDNSVIEKVSNLKTSAEVVFKVSANVTSEVLGGVTISIVFPYKTQIPGYKNTCENNECVIPYSKSEKEIKEIHEIHEIHERIEKRDEDTYSHSSYEKEDNESHLSFDDDSEFSSIALETLGGTLWTK